MGNVGAIVRCPTCKRTSAWSSENPYRPFCSDRCRLIDLGAWLSESHRIPGEPVSDDATLGDAADPTSRPPNAT